MKPFQSIRLRIRLIIGLLVAGLVVVSALAARQALEDRRQAERVEEIAGVSRVLLPALNLLRDERGATAGLIATPGEPDPIEIRYQDDLRAKSDPVVREAIDRLTAISPKTDLYDQVEIAERFERLRALRAEADAAIRLPADRRPGDLHARFISGMTDLTGALSESIARLTAEMGQDDAYIARMANVGRLAWTVRAAAGDDSLRWWTADIVGDRLTPVQVDAFQTLKARVDAPWSVLKDNAAHDGAPAEVTAAIAKAERLYFQVDRRMRADILDALATGSPAALPTAATRQVNTVGLYSLMSVADAAFGAVGAHAEAQAVHAKRDAGLALAAMAASIALGAGAAAFANTQVLALGRITAAMKAVAEGDMDHPNPDMGRPDEVGELARALDVFRANAVAKAALDEQLLASRIARETAEASAAAKAQFLANMSHEIRSPLTAVIGFADLLAEAEGLDGASRTYASRIQSGGKVLMALVNDILDVSRIEAGQVELAVQPCDPEALIEDAMGLMRLTAEGKGLVMALHAQALPPRIAVDPGRLRQVLLNLLSNAVKFTATGSITVHAAYRPDHGRLHVRVSDTGPGISELDRRRLFRRFSQIDGSNARQFGGAGLGLAISKGLIELMGGEIGLDSVEGAGSSFWFDIPAPPATAEEADVGRASTAPALTGGRPARVLVVDDLPVNLELVSALLSPCNLDLTLASSGAEAVDAAAREVFELILMDVQMPGMDGLAATRAIRESGGPNAATPILALSANVMADQVQAYRAAGMNDHIAKPMSAADLLGKIGRWTTRIADEPASDAA